MRGILASFFKVMTGLMHFRPAKPDIILRGSTEIVGFTVTYTPGHTGGSICLYCPEDIIFAGDALRSDRRGNPLGPSARMSLDIVLARGSLKRISELQFGVLLPGHGAPVVDRASDKVRSLLANVR